jgi:predicted Zn-dependent peptidase
VSKSQPLLFMAYKRPNQLDKDDPVFDVLSSILATGRTGLLYKELVRDKRIAVAAGAQASFPGGKYPNAFLLYAVPAVGRTVIESEKACDGIIERLKAEKVDEETLQRIKTEIRASLIRGLASNAGMAEQLTYYYTNYGDWRKLFTGIEDINKVTADDVQRVARQYLTPESRTVVYTVRPEAGK